MIFLEIWKFLKIQQLNIKIIKEDYKKPSERYQSPSKEENEKWTIQKSARRWKRKPFWV